MDDTVTGVTLNTLNENQKDILEQLNCIEQLHSDILFSLGHKLAIDKCSYYAADYTWGKPKHMSIDSSMNYQVEYKFVKSILPLPYL